MEAKEERLRAERAQILIRLEAAEADQAAYEAYLALVRSSLVSLPPYWTAAEKGLHDNALAGARAALFENDRELAALA